MKDWLVWFLLAIGLFVGEMFTAGFWLACLAVGAAVAGVVGLIPGLGFVTQGIAFAVSSIVSMAGLRPRLMHLLQLGPGSVLELAKAAGEPLDVLVNGKPIARGEAVMVNDRFGVRLTDIISPPDRLAGLK